MNAQRFARTIVLPQAWTLLHSTPEATPSQNIPNPQSSPLGEDVRRTEEVPKAEGAALTTLCWALIA